MYAKSKQKKIRYDLLHHLFYIKTMVFKKYVELFF